MRLLWLWLLIPALASGQSGPAAGPSDNLFLTDAPQVVVTVNEHATGADLVQMVIRNPGYPPDLLKEQIGRMGQELNAPPRGLFVVPPPANAARGTGYLRASFGTDGLVEGNRLRVGVIARMLAGAPEPYTIESAAILFQNKKPVPGVTVRDYRSKAVEVQAVAQPGPLGLEYRIRLKSQKPEEIQVPDQPREVIVRTNQMAPPTGPDPVVWGLVGLAALAAGALGYTLVLRGRPRRR